MSAISRQSPLKRYGPRGGGEPPTPGGSNLITSTAGSSSATNGSSSSRLAPMPLISSSGGRYGCVPAAAGFRAGRTLTRSSWRPTATLRTSAVVDIGSWRGALYRVALATELTRALFLLAAPRGQPGRIVGPPAAGHRVRRGEEVARVGRIGGRGLEGGLRVGRRVDHGGYVPAGGQDERDRAAEQLGGPVARLPRAEVIGDAGDYVGIGLHLGQVDRRAEHGGGVRHGERVGLGQRDEIAVQRGG